MSGITKTLYNFNRQGYIPDGFVTSALVDGNDVYLSGWFGKVGNARQHTGFTVVNMSDASTSEEADIFCNFDDAVQEFVIDGDYLYVAGFFTYYKNTVVNHFAKINMLTGELDPALHNGSYTGFSSNCYSIQEDGDHVFVGGLSTTYNGDTIKSVARIAKSDGTLDISFDPYTALSSVYKMILEGSSLYVFGSGVRKMSAVDGTVDGSFSSASTNVRYAVLDGSDIFMVGTTTRLAKIDKTTGTADATFLPDNPTNSVFGLAVDSTDIYICGTFSSIGTTTRQKIAKLDKFTGVIDATFDSTVGYSTGTAYQIVQDSSYIYVVANPLTYKGTTVSGLAKISKTDASVDTTFADDWGQGSGAPTDCTIRMIGSKLYIGGVFTSIRPNSNPSTVCKGAYKLDLTTGELNTIFDTTTGVSSDTGTTYKIIDDGDYIFILGNFSSYKGVGAGNIVKVSKIDASIDSTFASGIGSGASSYIYNGIIDGDDLYITGAFTSFNGTSRAKLAKINKNTGELDATFDTTTGSSASLIRFMVIDGDYLYMSLMGTYKGTTRQGVVKIDKTDASLDVTFDTTVGFNASQMNGMIVEDDYVYAAGNFTTYKGTTRQGIAKISKIDASLDATFDASVGFSAGGTYLAYPYDLISVSDGLIACGHYGAYKTTYTKKSVKINKTDASVVASYSSAPQYAFPYMGYMTKYDSNILYFGLPMLVENIKMGAVIPKVSTSTGEYKIGD